MRTFAAFFAPILLGFAAIALLAYPLWSLLGHWWDLPFHRVASRLGELVLIVGLVFVARRMGVGDRASLGYGLPRPLFLRELGIGLALGVATMLPIVLAMFALGLREPRDGTTLGLATLAPLAAVGVVRGLAVGFLEETLMRGAMYTGIRREAGVGLTILLTSALYACGHFFGSARIPAELVGPGSGIDILGGFLARFGQPLQIADAFLALAAVGALLGMVRTITGNIAACIGLHAGWVWIITFVREMSQPNEASPLRFLISQFDGVVGWLVLGWTLVIGAVLATFYRRRALAAAVQPAA